VQKYLKNSLIPSRFVGQHSIFEGKINLRYIYKIKYKK